ncbi:MAG TPA: HTTM domain-containing protein, partial [Byssovorax sp.]
MPGDAQDDAAAGDDLPAAPAPPLTDSPATDAPADPRAAAPTAPARRAPTRAEAAMRLRDFVLGPIALLRDHYARVDPRTAGLFRIGLGALMAGDALRHWHEADWAYSNAGVVTNHYHLFRPDSPYNFSILHAFSSKEEVALAFAIAVACHVCLMIGWHARLFAIVSCLIVTSIDNRLVMVENGGYVVVNLIAAYSMFLPIERRFSVDAIVRSYRERKERSVADLALRHRPATDTAPYVSLIGVLVVLNLAAVYFFNVVNKSGGIWRSGETVHYVLWLNRMVTGVAVVARSLMPFWLTRVFTWTVLSVEALLPMLILSPFGRRKTRPLAFVLLAGLHTAFGVMMRLGPFSWYLVGWGVLLFGPENWAALERWHRARERPRAVVLARGSALAFHLGRLLARLDAYELLRFEESPAHDASPQLVRVILDDGRALPTGDGGGAGIDGKAAARAIAAALPLGRWLFPAARVLSLGLLDLAISFVFDASPARRDAIARALGITTHARGLEADATVSPLRRRVRFGLAIVREIAVAWLVVCAFLQALVDNKSVPAWLKPKDLPAAFHATLGYPRMFQGWGMFAPNPITDDGSITVDAVTIEGRHVDPFTDEKPELDLTKSDGLGLSQIRQDYFNRIRLDRNKHYRDGLRTWLLAYPERTGRREDEIVSFDVYWVRDMCPRPGGKKPYDNKLIAIL